MGNIPPPQTKWPPSVYYINKQSNHPPIIIKNLPASISRRISGISCDEETFHKAAPAYNDALKSSGYAERLSFVEKQPKTKCRSRQRNIIWFIPPFSKSVATNIGGNLPETSRKALPCKIKTEKNIQQELTKSKLQLYAQCCCHHKNTQLKHLRKGTEQLLQDLQL